MADIPPPVPPHWMIRGFKIQKYPNGLSFSLETDITLHMTAYWSLIAPQVHRRAVYRRGFLGMWSQYFCFHGWHHQEQCQAGDTLVHYHLFDPWAVFEARSLVFSGTISGEETPSISPIFRVTRYPYGYIPLIEEYWNS